MGQYRQNKRRIIIGIIIAIAAIVAFGVLLYFLEARSAEKEDLIGDTGGWGAEEEPEEIYLSFTDGAGNYITTDSIDAYLIIGTDDGDASQTKKGFNGEMADFLTVLLIDNTKEDYAFLQLDRDTITQIGVPNKAGVFEGDVATEQLCTAHWYGTTPEERNRNTVNAVSFLLGDLPIKGYYSINMKDIAAVNHAVGGVVVDIDTDMTEVDPEFEKGASILLSDDQAEKFLRARMSVGKGTNAERMSRQRQYMQKVYNLVLSQLRENPDYINDLYNELEGTIDSELPAGAVGQIANQLRLYNSQGIKTFRGESKTGKHLLDDGIEHAEFYVDQSSVVNVLKQIINMEADDVEEEE